MCQCHDATAVEESLDPMFRVNDVYLGVGAGPEFAPSNWITDTRAPIFAQAPAPSDMNSSIMPILEARSYDLSRWYVRPMENSNVMPAYMDESANFLDEGYIGGAVQEG